MTEQEPHIHPQSRYTATTPPEALIRALLTELGANTSQPTMGELHRAICERVRAMRDEGAPPETVLATIKRLAARAVTEAAPTRPDSTTAATALVSHVAQWCIAEYFRSD